jgi:hypothetical protein
VPVTECHRSPCTEATRTRTNYLVVCDCRPCDLGQSQDLVWRHHRRTAGMIDIRGGPEFIAARLISRQPLVVGFSLIFRYFLPQYRHLANFLRKAGIRSHFTIGGHHPSLCHDEILRGFPELDSVVRYEGEEMLMELVGPSSGGRRLAPDTWDRLPEPGASGSNQLGDIAAIPSSWDAIENFLRYGCPLRGNFGRSLLPRTRLPRTRFAETEYIRSTGMPTEFGPVLP